MVNEEIPDANEANRDSKVTDKSFLETRMAHNIKDTIETGETKLEMTFHRHVDGYKNSFIKENFDILKKLKEKGYRICYSQNFKFDFYNLKIDWDDNNIADKRTWGEFFEGYKLF